MRWLVIAAVLFWGGCWNFVLDVCPTCRVVDFRKPVAPAPQSDGARAIVVLVPGAFGFGDEWKPVLDAIAARPALFAYVFDWPGPWSGPEKHARTLAAVLQQSLDGSPRSVDRVVVLAHSAGGMIADWAVRNVVVPPGKRVELIGLDGALRWRTFKAEEAVNSPIGFAVGGEREPYPGRPEHVAITHYICDDPVDARSQDDDGTVRIKVGKRAGHNEMVAKVAVPIVDALAPARR